MVQFKDKKKKSYNKKKKDEKTTIDSTHSKMLDNFNNEIKNIPNKKSELKKICEILEDLNKLSMYDLDDEKINSKLELEEKKKNLEEEINNIEENKDLNEYLLNTSHLLYQYFDEDNNFTNTTSKLGTKKSVLDFFGKKKENNIPIKNNDENTVIFKNKNDIMDKYLSLTDRNHVKNIYNIPNEELDNCPNCNISRKHDYIHGCLTCPMCGECEKILVDSDTPSYKEPPREITYFAYKKINHANEWLSQFQAKESTDISEDIFEKIQQELKKEAYIDLKHLTSDKIRDILKKLDLTKYYEHCHYITNRITGKPAPVIDGELEDKVRNMFKEIQGPWMKYCPSDRSNFFSYPYIFYKFFQLLDKDEYLPYCRLLKSREKLQEHDEVWKRICKDLRWQYIPTV